MARFHPLYGGHILQMRRCLPRLLARGVDVEVVTAALPGRAARDNLDGVALRRLPAPGPTTSLRMLCFGASVFLHLVATRRRWDVLHVVGISWHCYASILAARLVGKPVVVEMVMLGDDDPQSISRLRFGALKLAIWKRASRIASLSSALTAAARSAGIAPERIPEIPVGVDTELFCPVSGAAERSQLRESLGLPALGRWVVFVGGIMQRKGVDVLVEAWPAVLAADPAARLLLLGPSEENPAFREALERRITDLDIAPSVHLRGRVDDVDSYLKAADVFVLPSVTEGLPNSVLEAMACGLAPVMTDLPGISSDVIRSEAEGLLLPERTPAALAAALIELLSDAPRRQAIGAAARQRVVERFSITSRVERYWNLYRTLHDT
jgi:glycosyltransferase involved in cell wall biosynthesis